MQDRMAVEIINSESNRSNFKANSVANRKPKKIRENRCGVAEPRYIELQ